MGFISFFGYLSNLFCWVPLGWMPIVRFVVIVFLVWSLVRLIAHILDVIPFVG